MKEWLISLMRVVRHISYKWFGYGRINAVHQTGTKGQGSLAEGSKLEKTFRQQRDLSKDVAVGEWRWSSGVPDPASHSLLSH